MHAHSTFLVLPLVPVKNVVALAGSTTDQDGLAGMGQDRMMVFTRFCSSMLTGQGDGGCWNLAPVLSMPQIQNLAGSGLKVVPFEGILGPPIPCSPAVPPVPLSRI